MCIEFYTGRSKPIMNTPDDVLLETCLRITGGFENGFSYQGVTGGFDGEGLSVGVLQWNAGAGTLSQLLRTISLSLGWAKMDAFFPHGGMEALADALPHEAIQMCLDRFLVSGHPSVVDPTAKAAWEALLSTPEAIAAQNTLAKNGIYASAKRMAAFYFAGEDATNPRTIAFFFDLAVQQGYMHGIPGTTNPDIAAALQFTRTKYPEVAERWQAIASTDPLAKSLLYYGFERARLGKVAYWWGCLSRRGSIACRVGIVEGSQVDFTAILP
jgi:hypothetical protein